MRAHPVSATPPRSGVCSCCLQWGRAGCTVSRASLTRASQWAITDTSRKNLGCSKDCSGSLHLKYANNVPSRRRRRSDRCPRPEVGENREPEEIQKKTGLAYLHTTHCLGTGEIMVSAMGDPDGKAKGAFLILDSDFKVTVRRKRAREVRA